MMFVRFHCQKCGEIFRKFGLMARSDSTATCPKCGQTEVALLEEDRKRLAEIEHDEGCTSFG